MFILSTIQSTTPEGEAAVFGLKADGWTIRLKTPAYLSVYFDT